MLIGGALAENILSICVGIHLNASSCELESPATAKKWMPNREKQDIKYGIR